MMPLGIGIFRFFKGFWKKRAMLHRKCIQKSILYETGVQAEKYYETNIILLKMKFQGSKNRTKINQNRLKKDAKMGIALQIDFFMDFRRFSWIFIGIINRQKNDPKNIKKKDSKEKASGGEGSSGPGRGQMTLNTFKYLCKTFESPWKIIPKASLARRIS